MRFLALILLLTLSLAIHTVRGGCDGREDGFYQGDGNKFIQCVGGVEYDFACSDGLVFDPVNKICNWPTDVHNNPPTDGPNNPTDGPHETQGPPQTQPPDTNHGGQTPTGSQCARIVCYFTNWAQYRPTDDTKQFPTDVDPSLCTHIIYAFAKFSGNTLAPFEWNDESTDWAPGNYEKATNLKQKNPSLKVSIAVGGWNLGSDPFSQMVASDASMNEFVSSTVKFLRDHKFDGLDLDWEYPANRGSPPEDKGRFTQLVGALRAAFNQEASGDSRLLLTAAVAAGKSNIDTAYDIPAISQNLDWINLMTYDLHGGWEAYTGHNSPLYADSQDTGDNAYLNIDWAAKYWAQKGAPKNKIVVGLGLYGRSFTLSSTSNTGLYAPAAIGSSGTYTREAGYLAYYEICQLKAQGGVVNTIADQHVPYLVAGNQWVGFDNQDSLREKVRYIRDNGFGGAMVWALDLDDFKGKFCGQGNYPLLSAIKDECFK